MLKVFNFIIMLLFLTACQAQNQYQGLAKEIDKGIPPEYIQIRKELLKSGVELSLVLPKDHSQKGDIDYTKELQKGVDKGGTLLLPNYPLLVNEKGLVLKSNTKLVFRENSKLIMKANAETHYSVITIREVQNVDVYFANIEGDRDTHLIKKGEWGMGIRIQAAKDVNLIAPTISDCWGDGIYIASVGDVPSERIAVSNFKIHRARRNGISIISVDGLQLNNGLIADTYGTAPQSALDIEPNRPTDILNSIIIKDLTTYNSSGDGIMMSLSNLTLETKGNKKIANKKVDIVVDNHRDISSQYALRINGRGASTADRAYKTGRLGGGIVIVNPIWTDYKDESPVRFSPKKDRVLDYDFNPSVSFKNVKLLNTEGKEIKDSEKIISSFVLESKKL